MLRLESEDNKKIRLAAALHTKKRREKEGCFIVEGVRLAEMAAESAFHIRFGFMTKEQAETTRGAALLAALSGRTDIFEIAPALMKKISGEETPQGVMLVVESKKNKLAELASLEEPLYVVLDAVQDPGNVGTIIRAADALGASGVLLTKGSAEVFSEKVVRSTMGSIFHVPVVAGLLAQEVLDFAQARGCEVFVTALDAEAVPIYERDFTGASLIIFGNEGAGVSEELLAAGKCTYIPMTGGAESLNVGVAASIALYEAHRQRLIR